MAQYFRDFSTDTQGVQPADTTLKRSAVSGDYTVQTDGADPALQYLNTSGTVAARGLAYDLAPSSGVMNVSAIVRDIDTSPASARLVVFASDAPDNEYGVILSSAGTELAIYRRINGQFSVIASSTRAPVDSTGYYNVEFEVTPGSPNTLKAWYWPEGGTKPATPDIDITNSDLTLTAGWSGHIGFDGDGPEVFFKRIGIGTNGDPAPTGPVGGGTDTLSANDISSTSQVSAPSIGQAHALTPLSVTSNSAVTSPTIGQTHGLTGADLQATSQVSSSALSSASTTDSLTANDIRSASSVTSPALGQVHNIAANDVASTSETGSPALNQEHALTSVDISSLSTVSSPALTDVAGTDTLAANDVGSQSETGTPSLSQVHVLIADSLESDSSTSEPGIAQVHQLSATGVQSLSEVGAPALRDASLVLKTPIRNTKATVSQATYKAAIMQTDYNVRTG